MLKPVDVNYDQNKEDQHKEESKYRILRPDEPLDLDLDFDSENNGNNSVNASSVSTATITNLTFYQMMNIITYILN